MKQTFQHFEIHSQILVKIDKGEKIKHTFDFNKQVNGILYLGSNCFLNKEQHLSNNQKETLQTIFSFLQESAPIEFYTFKKIKVENVSNYTVNETFILRTVATDENFVIWRDGTRKKQRIRFGSGYEFLNLIEPKKIELRFGATNKIAANKEFKIFNFGTNENIIIRSDEKGNVPSNLIEFFEEAHLTIVGNNDYFNSFGAIIHYDNFDIPIENQIYDSYDVQNMTTIISLHPFISLIFEPYSFSHEFHNAQAIFGNKIFSKKSIFKKSDKNFGNLKIYDNFFEKIFMSNYIKIPIGGVIDINTELNPLNFKELNFKIIFNHKHLENRKIKAFLVDENPLDINSIVERNEIQIRDDGMIKIPEKSTKIMVKFIVNKIEYTRLINLNQITSDTICLNFNKRLDIQLSPKVLDAYLKANSLVNNARTPDSHPIRIDNSNVLKNIQISNSNSSIILTDSESAIYVEDVDYMIREKERCGVKTNYNQLKACNLLVKSNLSKIEVIPVSDLDYTTYQINVEDENGNEIKTDWCIVEIRNFVGDSNSFFSREFDKISEEYQSDKTPAFYKDFTVGEEAITNKTVYLLNDRVFSLAVIPCGSGYMDYFETFSTKENVQINKKVILRKSNSIKYQNDNENEMSEITKILKMGDIIYEYNGVRIKNKDTFSETQQICNQEKVTIKLIRDKMPMTLIIPAYQIHGLVDNYFEDKEGLLTH